MTSVAVPGLFFDEWRRGYDSMSFDDQKRFYRQCAQHWPSQQHYSLYRAREFIARYRPRTVVELGGWDGALANQLIDNHVLSWRNYDLVQVPQVCTHRAYELKVLDRPLWEHRTLRADAFVCTHTIEHIRFVELERLVGLLAVKACLVEAPLNSYPREWWGYEGSHILEVGWDGVDELFDRYGYRVGEAWSAGRFYQR